VNRTELSCEDFDITWSSKRIRKFACLIVLSLVGVLPIQGQAQQPEKYRLVYMVAAEAENVQAGADVVVEPIFFTNGNDVVLLYDYCWVVYMKNPPKGYSLLPAQIADDVKFINEYCGYNKNITLDGSKFHTLNNNGESVRLGKIEFGFPGGRPQQRRGTQLTPTEVGRSKIVAVLADTPNVVHANTTEPFKFYFMASSAALLKKILPLRRADPQEEAQLLKQAGEYAEEKKGIERRRGGFKACPIDAWCDGKTDARFQDAKTRLVSPLLGDFDGDEKLDLAVGMQADSKDFNSSWLATGLIYGNQKRGLASGSWAPTQSNLFNLGNFVYLPQGLFRFAECKRVIHFEEHNYLRMLSVPPARGTCQDIGSARAPLAIRPGTSPTR
jgi:hypothetical protein